MKKKLFLLKSGIALFVAAMLFVGCENSSGGDDTAKITVTFDENVTVKYGNESQKTLTSGDEVAEGEKLTVTLKDTSKKFVKYTVNDKTVSDPSVDNLSTSLCSLVNNKYVYDIKAVLRDAYNPVLNFDEAKVKVTKGDTVYKNGDKVNEGDELKVYPVSARGVVGTKITVNGETDTAKVGIQNDTILVNDDLKGISENKITISYEFKTSPKATITFDSAKVHLKLKKASGDNAFKEEVDSTGSVEVYANDVIKFLNTSDKAISYCKVNDEATNSVSGILRFTSDETALEFECSEVISAVAGVFVVTAE